ncbi:MAG: hypothetical protein ABIP77_00270 [Candidatus Limnocylindrales bacterium]
MRTRIARALFGAAILLAVAVAPAFAHQHSLTTSGGNVVCLSDHQEGADPSNGAMAAGNKWVPDTMIGGGIYRGHHPMHWFLHLGPGQVHSAITMTVGCP